MILFISALFTLFLLPMLWFFKNCCSDDEEEDIREGGNGTIPDLKSKDDSSIETERKEAQSGKKNDYVTIIILF